MGWVTVSLRDRLTVALEDVVALPDGPECAICPRPVRPSHNRVDTDDGPAHRDCLRFAQAVGREINRRDRVVRADD